ncbi:MAG: hypothetical protein M1820_005644 [Bogoriella megaspora]|nr:MAG: hypothetical protein M1820_005644 [Bogoriella megaspora]
MPNLLVFDDYIVSNILSFLTSSDLLNIVLTCGPLLPLARLRLFRHISFSRHRDSHGEPLVKSIHGILDSQPECQYACHTLELLGKRPNPLYGRNPKPADSNKDDHGLEEADADKTNAGKTNAHSFNGIFAAVNQKNVEKAGIDKAGTENSGKKDAVFPSPRDIFHGENEVLVQHLPSQADAEYISLVARFKGLRELVLGLQFSGLYLQLDGCHTSLRRIAFKRDELCLGHEYYTSNLISIDPKIFQSIFQLPAIEEVDITVPPTQLTRLQLDALPQTSSLSTLTLDETCLDAEELEKLLAKTSKLCKFHFGFLEDRNREHGMELQDNLSLIGISSALLQVADTLEELKITMAWHDGENRHDGEWSTSMQRMIFGPEGNLELKDMKRLHFLHALLAILLGLFPRRLPALLRSHSFNTQTHPPFVRLCTLGALLVES